MARAGESMKRRLGKGSFFAVGTAVVAAGLLLTACFTANLSGTASSPSPIAAFGPSGATGLTTKKVEFNLVSKASFATGFGGTNGYLKDAGTSPFFPRGVKISFRNGMSIGMGEDCTDINDGPSRRVHGITSTSVNPTDYCTLYADPRFWIGMVTYSSADARYYPNQGFAPCNDYYQAFLSEFAGSFLLGPVSAKASSGSTAENISGFGIATVIDTNYNRNYDHGDRFSFVPVCGPFTHLDGSQLFNAPIAKAPALDLSGLPASLRSILKPAVQPKSTIYPSDPTQYNYVSCGAIGGPFPGYGGVLPAQYVDDNPYIAITLSAYCAFYQPGTSGDLKIGIGTRITTTSTTSSTLAPSGPSGP